MSDFNTIKNDTKTRMEKTIETLKGDFGSLRAGRAHVSLLDGIMVEAYGSRRWHKSAPFPCPMPVRSLSAFGTADWPKR